MKYEEIYKQLPGSWAELKLRDFVKLTDLELVEQDQSGGMQVSLDSSIAITSALTGLSTDELEANLTFAQALKVDAKLKFMNTLPPISKDGKIKWVKLDKVSYNSFVRFNQLSADLFHNIPLIIQAFAENEMTIEEIEGLPMSEAYSGFFLLRRMSEKYLNSSRNSLILRLTRQTFRELFQKFLTKIRLR